MNGLRQNNSWLEVSEKAGQNSLTLNNSLFLTDPFSTGIAQLRIEQSGGATAVVQQGAIRQP